MVSPGGLVGPKRESSFLCLRPGRHAIGTASIRCDAIAPSLVWPARERCSPSTSRSVPSGHPFHAGRTGPESTAVVQPWLDAKALPQAIGAQMAYPDLSSRAATTAAQRRPRSVIETARTPGSDCATS